MNVAPFLVVAVALNGYFVYRFAGAAIETRRRWKNQQALLHAHRKGFLTNQELMDGTSKMLHANEEMNYWGVWVAGAHLAILALSMFL